jgi:CDP-diacylglycerol--serine O-phosphatidyltransferase
MAIPKDYKIKNIVPSIITYLNLLCGFASILLSINGYYTLAVISLILSAIFDFLDGRSARYLDAITPIGEQLDSLADIVSFGISPLVLIFAKFSSLNFLLISTCILYLFAGTFRLARYNISEKSTYFHGVPITIAGLMLAFTVFFNHIITAITALILAYIMLENRIIIKKR